MKRYCTDIEFVASQGRSLKSNNSMQPVSNPAGKLQSINESPSVSDFNVTILQLRHEINTLKAQVDFLMSLVGITEIPNSNLSRATDSVGSDTQATTPTIQQTSKQRQHIQCKDYKGLLKQPL